MVELSYQLAEALGKRLQGLHMRLALAESCSGGGIAYAVTAVPGSSRWFDRGFVTYSNVAKSEMLGVRQATLERFGAVSRQTALEMAAGALHHSRADVALAVTGIAGPDGGSVEKPVGTVFFAWQRQGGDAVGVEKLFAGDRETIRRQVVEFGLQALVKFVADVES